MWVIEKFWKHIRIQRPKIHHNIFPRGPKSLLTSVVCASNFLPSQVLPQEVKTNVLADLRCDCVIAPTPTTRIGGVSHLHESPVTERHRTFFLVAFPAVPSKRNVTSVSIGRL